MSFLINPFVYAASGGGGGPPSSRLASIVGSKLYLELPIGGGWYTDAGTTPATTTGDLVYQWSDVSGNNRHFTQTNSAKRPTLDTATTHLTFPTVRFQANLVQYLIGPDMSALTEAEIFTIIQLENDPPSNGDGGLDRFYPSGVSATHVPYVDGNIYDSFGTTSRKTVGNPPTSLAGAFRVYHRRSKSNDWACYINNGNGGMGATDVNGDPCVFSTTSNTVGFNTAVQLGATESEGSKITGRIAGMAICSPALTSAERAAAYAALTT